MKLWLFMMIALLAAAPVAAQDVYRWVDEHGTVHYSDKPRDGAERIVVRPPQTYESEARTRAQATDPDAPVDTGEEASYYRAIRIVAPENEGAVWATGGGFTVVVEVTPALRPGDRIKLTLNGEQVPGTPVANNRISVTGLIRGPHTLQAAVVAAESQQVLIFSEDVNFNVLQASIHSPQRRR